MYGSSSQADTATPVPSVGARSQVNGRPSLRRHHSENKTTSGRERARPAPSRSSSVAAEGTRRGGGGSSGLDMQSLASILTNPSIPFLKALISTDNFASLPPEDQLALVRLLPECDQIVGSDNVLRMSQTALSNEFFSKSLTEWSEKATEGEFTLDKLSVNSSGSATSGRSAAGGGAAGDGGGEKDHARCESLRSSSSSSSSGVGNQLNGPNGCFAGSHSGGWTELCKAFRERHPREIPKAGLPFIPAPKVTVNKTKGKGQPAAAAAADTASAVAGAEEEGEGRDGGGSGSEGGSGSVGKGFAESTASTKMQAPELTLTVSASPTDVASRVGDVASRIDDVASRVGDVAASVVTAGNAAALACVGSGSSLASSANSPNALATDAKVTRKRPPQLRPSRIRPALLGVGASLLRVANAGRVAAAASAAAASTEGSGTRAVAVLGTEPVVGTEPPAGILSAAGTLPAAGTRPAAGMQPAVGPQPAGGPQPVSGPDPAGGTDPAVVAAAGLSGVVCNGVDGVRCRALSDTSACAGSGGTPGTAASCILASAAEKARRGDALTAVQSQAPTTAVAANRDTTACAAEESLSRQACSEMVSIVVPVTAVAEALKQPVLISRDGVYEVTAAAAAGSCKRLRLCPQVSAAEAAAVAAATAAATAAAVAAAGLPPPVPGTSALVATGACDRPAAMPTLAAASVAAATGEAAAALQSNGAMLSDVGPFSGVGIFSGVSECSVTSASGSLLPPESVGSLFTTSTGWTSVAASTTAEETLHQGQAKTLAQIKAMTRAKQMLKNSSQSVAASSAAFGYPDTTVATAAAVAGLSVSPPFERGRARAVGAAMFFNTPGVPESGVNLQRSLAICQASSSTPQTINYTRSYEICKEVLQKSNNTGMMSLLYKQQQQQQHQLQQHQQQQQQQQHHYHQLQQHQLQQHQRHPSFSINSCPSFAQTVADGTAATSNEAVTSSVATVSTAPLLGATDVRIKWPDPLPVNTEVATAIAAVPTEITPIVPPPPVDVTNSRVAVTNLDHVPGIFGSAVHGAVSESTSRTLQALLPEPASSHPSSVLAVGQTAVAVAVTVATGRSAGLCKVDEPPAWLPCTTSAVVSQQSLPEQSSIGAVCPQLPSDCSYVACVSPCAAQPAPVTALPSERNSSCAAAAAADRERLACLLKAKLQDRNLAHQPLVAVACGGGIYLRRRRKPVVASHPLLSMTDKEYAYSIKVHKKKVAVRPMKKHKAKGKKAGAHRTAGSRSRTSGSALLASSLPDVAAAARSDSAASNEDWCTASDSSATKMEECCADSPAGESLTLAAAAAAECASSSSLAAAATPSFASASATAGCRTAAPAGAEDAAGRPTTVFESLSDRSSPLHTGQGLAANSTVAAVRCGQAAGCLHRCQSTGNDDLLQPAGAASSAAEEREISRVAVARTSSAVRPPANCSCNLKATRECPKCGALSHEECCVTSNLCASCLASI